MKKVLPLDAGPPFSPIIVVIANDYGANITLLYQLPDGSNKQLSTALTGTDIRRLRKALKKARKKIKS